MPTPPIPAESCELVFSLLRRGVRVGHGMAWQEQRHPKKSKLTQNPGLRQVVQQLLDKRYSPDQIAGRLKILYPDDESMRVSRQTICQSLMSIPRTVTGRTALLTGSNTSAKQISTVSSRGPILSVPAG